MCEKGKELQSSHPYSKKGEGGGRGGEGEGEGEGEEKGKELVIQQKMNEGKMHPSRFEMKNDNSKYVSIYAIILIQYFKSPTNY